MRVFTIGHSTHSLAAFVELLRTHAIERVADIRAHPGSRRMPWFMRSALARELPAHGIDYVHMAQLGGRRRPVSSSPNGGWRTEGFRGYADHMATAEFGAAIGELERLASERATAFMCSEGLWWRCHRRLVADALVARGWEVLHIDPRGETTAHALTTFVVVDGPTLRYPVADVAR